MAGDPSAGRNHFVVRSIGQIMTNKTGGKTLTKSVAANCAIYISAFFHWAAFCSLGAGNLNIALRCVPLFLSSESENEIMVN